MPDSPKSERKDDRLWGGRFEREPDKAFDAFQRSFSFDRRLLPYELAVDRAWARALQTLQTSPMPDYSHNSMGPSGLDLA